MAHYRSSVDVTDGQGVTGKGKLRMEISPVDWIGFMGTGWVGDEHLEQVKPEPEPALNGTQGEGGWADGRTVEMNSGVVNHRFMIGSSPFRSLNGIHFGWIKFDG